MESEIEGLTDNEFSHRADSMKVRNFRLETYNAKSALVRHPVANRMDFGRVSSSAAWVPAPSLPRSCVGVASSSLSSSSSAGDSISWKGGREKQL